LSALLLSASLATSPLSIRVDGNLVSQPYIEMTIQLCKRFGAIVQRPSIDTFMVLPAKLVAANLGIEPDASAASYFMAMAAITRGTITIEGLGKDSLQGDVGFLDLLKQMGCTTELRDSSIVVTGNSLKGIDCDMSKISDTAQTLSVVALFAEGSTTIRGIAHNRVKETDRIGNLAIELRKLGATVHEFDDGMTIVPGQLRPAKIETYNDHRMAMSLALAGLLQPGVRITNPECVQKTFPDYFDVLQRLVNSPVQ
jgi:3-phosphoshikimate 1-carboxyvinyltransferase